MTNVVHIFNSITVNDEDNAKFQKIMKKLKEEMNKLLPNIAETVRASLLNGSNWKLIEVKTIMQELKVKYLLL